MSDTPEEVLVLYGTQTGNSEAAAEEITSSLSSQLSKLPFKVTPKLLTLDDFLELRHGEWTRVVVIVCSSYGVGQAPLGARKFREWCDEVLERYGHDPADVHGDDERKFLSGVKFALCGLGDSHYTTYFRNPTVIEEALTTLGAVRVGKLGKADASGTDDMEQSKVIDRWIGDLWGVLETSIVEQRGAKAMNEGQLQKAKDETWKLCLELNPDWKPTNYKAMGGVLLPLLGVIIGILIHLAMNGWKL